MCLWGIFVSCTQRSGAFRCGLELVSGPGLASPQALTSAAPASRLQRAATTSSFSQECWGRNSALMRDKHFADCARRLLGPQTCYNTPRCYKMYLGILHRCHRHKKGSFVHNFKSHKSTVFKLEAFLVGRHVQTSVPIV